MRIGVMVGPERGRYGTKVDRLRADARWAEEAGLASVWIPQIPDEFDALTAATLLGVETTRIEIGTAVVPVQPRHPIALAQQALSVQAVCEGRLALGLGVSHHWIIDEMLGLPYERPARHACGPTSTCSTRPSPGPGTVDVENELFRVHNPLDVTDVAPDPGPARRPRPADARSSPASAPTARSSGWPTSGPSVARRPPASPGRPRRAGRPAPRIVAGIPVCLCGDDEVDVAVARTNRILSEAEVSPNYQKLLDLGDARNVGDLLAAGSEATVEKRLRSLRRRRRHRPLGPRRADRRRPRRAASPRQAHPHSCAYARRRLDGRP